MKELLFCIGALVMGVIGLDTFKPDNTTDMRPAIYTTPVSDLQETVDVGACMCASKWVDMEARVSALEAWQLHEGKTKVGGDPEAEKPATGGAAAPVDRGLTVTETTRTYTVGAEEIPYVSPDGGDFVEPWNEPNIEYVNGGSAGTGGRGLLGRMRANRAARVAARRGGGVGWNNTGYTYSVPQVSTTYYRPATAYTYTKPGGTYKVPAAPVRAALAPNVYGPAAFGPVQHGRVGNGCYQLPSGEWICPN